MNRPRIADTLEQARTLGDGGNCWGRGRNYHAGTGRYCLRGLIAKVVTGDPYGHATLITACRDWLRQFMPAVAPTLELFNDTHGWPDVDALLARAAQEARA